MSRSVPPALAVLLLSFWPNPLVAQIGPETVYRGKRATALVEISHNGLSTLGTAFCIDESGLFVTTSRVVDKAAEKNSVLRLVLNAGLPSQRAVRAKVYRRDNEANLAILETSDKAGLMALELGRDADVKELNELVTFGYPLGKVLSVNPNDFPQISVLPSRITTLSHLNGRLMGFVLETSIAPGNSGGPVLDASGKVVGVAVASANETAREPMIPVGRLREFLAAPGVIFEMPPVLYDARTKPATWDIQVQPPTPKAKLPEDLSVTVRVKANGGRPRRYTAAPIGHGAYRARVMPYLDVDLSVRDSATRQFQFGVYMKDHGITVGGTKLLLSDLDFLYGGASPRVRTTAGREIRGKIAGLGGGMRMFDNKAVTIDLSQDIEITVQKEPLKVGSLPWPSLESLVEVKQGSKVVARSQQQAMLTVSPRKAAPAGASVAANTPGSSPGSSHSSSTPRDDRLKLGRVLDIDGIPVGAGKSIQPPKLVLPEAQLGSAADQGSSNPLIMKLNAPISNVVVGGGGRYLLLTQKDAHSLAVFDVNAAAIVKTISLPSANALVAAGASKFLIVFPDEKLIQRWNLNTLQREGGNRVSPIDGQIKALAMGADSNGPVLAFWGYPAQGNLYPAWLSMIDPDSLTVFRVGGAFSVGGSGTYKGQETVSPSGGAFQVESVGGISRIHIRSAAGGTLFGIWNSNGWPSGFHTLSVHGKSLFAINEYGPFAHLAPGCDGQTVFTGSGGRLDTEGKPQARSDSPRAETAAEMTIPTSDALYYLSIGGLPAALPEARHPSPPPGGVTLAVHATGDGARLLSVTGLSEMAGLDRHDLFIESDFTIDKRFHLVQAAKLLITIPASNDRLVLRRLDLDAALNRAGGDYLIAASLPLLVATPGQKLEHQIVVKSRKGGITYTLANGPDGLSVTPEGKITWLVPKGHARQDAKAVVSVGDASDKELFLTLRICIQ